MATLLSRALREIREWFSWYADPVRAGRPAASHADSTMRGYCNSNGPDFTAIGKTVTVNSVDLDAVGRLAFSYAALCFGSGGAGRISAG